jgi:ribosomal protein L37AE/L43A
MGCSWGPWSTREQQPNSAASSLRWPDGFQCPDCGSPKAWLTSNKLFRCGACESAVSVTTGTIFQDTRKPLQLWFQSMW